MSAERSQQPPSNNSAHTPPPTARGPAGRGRGRTSGRTLVNVRSPNTPISVHTGSGVPFGHVPAYLPGSSSLVEELEKRLLIVLRDGKHIIGTLTSFDQFSNLVLRDSVERRMVRSKEKGTCFCDVPMGIYIVRGDSMVLCGVYDGYMIGPLTEVSLEDLEKLEQNALAPLQWDFDADLIA